MLPLFYVDVPLVAFVGVVALFARGRKNVYLCLFVIFLPKYLYFARKYTIFAD